MEGVGKLGEAVRGGVLVALHFVVQLLKRGSCGPRSTHTANLCAAIKNKAAHCASSTLPRCLHSPAAPNPLPSPLSLLTPPSVLAVPCLATPCVTPKTLFEVCFFSRQKVNCAQHLPLLFLPLSLSPSLVLSVGACFMCCPCRLLLLQLAPAAPSLLRLLLPLPLPCLVMSPTPAQTQQNYFA